MASSPLIQIKSTALTQWYVHNYQRMQNMISPVQWHCKSLNKRLVVAVVPVPVHLYKQQMYAPGKAVGKQLLASQFKMHKHQILELFKWCGEERNMLLLFIVQDRDEIPLTNNSS